MNKYDALYKHLLQLGDVDEWRVSFSEIESVLGFTLPKSARVYRPWWSNQGANSGHSHSMAWTNAGWKTSRVDMHAETLVLEKVGTPDPVSSESATRQTRTRSTVQEKVISLLEKLPEGATNKEISIALNRSPTHIYQETSLMERRGLLRSVRVGRAYKYSLVNSEVNAAESQAQHTDKNENRSCTAGSSEFTPHDFQRHAGKVMSETLGVPLTERETSDVPKRFDFVSPDGSIVGDAKFYSMVRGQGLPPAKFATIAEHVWLLEKTEAKDKFMVFGNDRRVPSKWLEKYGMLVRDVTFYFLDEKSKLEVLN